MRRERIDAAIHAQLDRRTSLLRDFVRSGGRETWGHLYSHGHKHPTLKSAVRDKYVTADGIYYDITDSGRCYLDDIDAEQLRRQT